MQLLVDSGADVRRRTTMGARYSDIGALKQTDNAAWQTFCSVTNGILAGVL